MSSKPRKTVREPGRRREWGIVGVPLLLIILSVLLYSNTLDHGFVFDDVTLILQNPQVVELDWLSIVWQGGYRPARTLTYAVNYALGGENPFGYHLLNILLHACNAALVFIFLWLLSQSRLMASVAGFIYAIHPVQTAAVAYISGRKDLLAAFFLLIGLVLYLLFRRSPSGKKWKLGLSYFCFLMAVLSKEVALVFPGLLLMIDAVLEWQVRREADGKGLSLGRAIQGVFHRYPLRYLCFAILGVLASLWVVFINQASRMEGYWGGSVCTNFGTSFKLFVHYLKLAIFPSPLIADYLGDVFPVSTGFLEPATILAILVTIVYLVVVWWVFEFNPLVSLAMFWFLVLLLPILQLVPFHELAADHFEYLPLVGAVLAAGIGFSYVIHRFNMRVLLCSGLGFLALGSSLLVLQRNRDWQNIETLWEATYRAAPGSYRANANLGQIYFRQGLESNVTEGGKVDEGLRLTQRSIELDPSRSVSWGNMGAMYLTLGQKHREANDLKKARDFQYQAITHFQKASELEPGNAFTESNLGNVYKELGNIYEAEGDQEEALVARQRAAELYSHALRTDDRRHEVQLIWLNFGGVCIDAGYYDHALHYLTEFLKAYPEDPRGNYWLGFCLTEQGEYERAIPYLEQAVRGKPTVEAWRKLALSYGNSGQIKKAIDGYSRILAVTPDSGGIHYELGLLYRKAGDASKALSHLNQALRLDPDGEHSVHIRRLLGNQGNGGSGVRITQQEEI